MARLVNCAHCKLKVDKDSDLAAVHNSKNYHKSCLTGVIEREELLSYICTLFSLKAPGPIIYSQLKNFFEKNPNWTYRGVQKSLLYFYEVKNNSKQKSNQAIGIVPYVYDEAQEYFEKLEYKTKVVTKTIEKQIEQKPLIINIKKREEKKTNKKLYDLENL